MIVKVLAAVISFLLGIGTGWMVINSSSDSLSSSLIEPVTQQSFFDFNKLEQAGFMPYWLIDKAEGDYRQLTTLTYFGLVMDENGNLVERSRPTETEPGWRTLELGKFADKAKTLPDAKLSLLIHNANEASIAALIADPVPHARTLVDQVEPLMKQHKFSDLNLDIESFREASDEARTNFAAFVRTVDEEMEQRDLGSLTVEIAPIALVKKYLIDPEQVGQIADRVVLMAYDYHYSGSYNAGPVAPVGGAGEIWEYDVETAIKEAVKVMPAEKILLGIPLYGYQWETLRDSPGSPVIPGSSATASQRRMEELLQDCPQCVRYVGEYSLQPQVIYPEAEYFEQVFYEDGESAQKKMDLAKQYQLGGVAYWALGYEGSQFELEI